MLRGFPVRMGLVLPERHLCSHWVCTGNGRCCRPGWRWRSSAAPAELGSTGAGSALHGLSCLPAPFKGMLMALQLTAMLPAWGDAAPQNAKTTGPKRRG